MIDNQKQVKELLQQMEKQLPIPVLATDGLVRSMKRQLPELKRQRNSQSSRCCMPAMKAASCVTLRLTEQKASSYAHSPRSRFSLIIHWRPRFKPIKHARIRKLAARGLGKPQRFTIRPR